MRGLRSSGAYVRGGVLTCNNATRCRRAVCPGQRRQHGKVLDVVRIPRPPHPGPKPGVKVDARSERWREHRKKVRGEIVDAAFRAIERWGPS